MLSISVDAAAAECARHIPPVLLKMVPAFVPAVDADYVLTQARVCVGSWQANISHEKIARIMWAFSSHAYS